MNLLVWALVLSICGSGGDFCLLGEGGVAVPRPVLYARAPVYTELARRAGVEGQEWVAVTVRPDGTVESAEVDGYRLPMGLDRAGENAAKEWRFVPSNREHHLLLRFDFRIPNDPAPTPPVNERLGAYTFRVWAQQFVLDRRLQR
jgi:TonB family protein